jgi:hypothetical protein
MASRISWTPLFFKADPQKTGTSSPASVARRSPARICSTLGSWLGQKSSISSSSASLTFSINSSRAICASSRSSGGISPTVKVAPRSASFGQRAVIARRSMIPRKPSSAPIGRFTGTGLAPRRSTMLWTALPKSAPIRSILLMNAMRGTE